MEKYRVLFFGTWGYGKAGLEGLLSCSNVEIVQVFTKWDASQADPYMNQVKDLAERCGLSIYNTGREVCSKAEFEAAILAHKDIDLLISCCYDRIFKNEHLEVAKLAALNMHPSMLPKYRGIKPLENAIVNGEEETGVTLHKLTDSLDAGEIVLQGGGISISGDQTYEELYREQCKLITAEMHRFFEAPMEHLIHAYPQNEKEISWAPRLAFEIKNWMTVKMISLAHLGEWGSDFLGTLQKQAITQKRKINSLSLRLCQIIYLFSTQPLLPINMRTLLVVPQRYGFHESFKAIFEHLGSEVYAIDFYDFAKKWEQKINTQIFRLPSLYRMKWESYYYGKINRYYREAFDRIQPNIVFIYNNELLLPGTLQYFKERGAKIGFYLGDSPFFTPTSRYFLQLLDQADAVFAPDSFWIQQLKKIGLKNIHLFYPNAPTDAYFPQQLPEGLYDKLQVDILYVGMSYTDSWGYKKAKFLNHFTDFDLKIIGNEDWKRWFRDFPALESHYEVRGAYLSVEDMNNRYNASKIIPIDGNPGILHGVYWRMIEVLCAGALPLMEWQKGLEEIFPKGMDLPAVHTYDAIEDMVRYYLNHQQERLDIVEQMRRIILDRFSVANNADQLAEALELAGALS